MKTLTIYISEDGVQFQDEQKCREYEEKAVLPIYALYKEIYGDAIAKMQMSSFYNGGGYFQHTEASKSALKSLLLSTANSYLNVNHDDINYNLGRMLNDGDYTALYELFVRLMSIDVLNKEFGQPYYVGHCNEAKLFKIN